MNPASLVTALSGIGPSLAKKLEKLEINTVFDLLYHLPFRYLDRSLITPAALVQVGELVTIIGQIDSITNIRAKSGKMMQKASLSDSSGKIDIIWFYQPYLTRTLKPNQKVSLSGKVDFFNRRPALISPDYELLTPNSESVLLLHTGRLVPIYPETAGLTSKWLRTKIHSLLSELASDRVEPFAQRVQPSALGWKQALQNIHFPQNLDQVQPARQRLAFDELLLLQIRALKHKQQWQATKLAHSFAIDQEKILQFINALPFNLTPSQNQALKDILTDLSASVPMNRLLEGDVGSGKTVVAATTAYIAYLNGFQTLFMAPTQILASQHHATLSALFKPFGIEVGLITSQSKLKINNSSRSASESSILKIIVGTHALLNQALQLNEVGLVIIDEQHRFGVVQRAAASARGQSPHVLTMTATPIPRTIALTLYGDLDLSLLTDMPPGRLPVKTWVVPESKRAAAYEWIKKQQTQIFIVCPFIEESETLTSVKSAKSEYAKLAKIFSESNLGLLHGKLQTKDKQQVITKFRAGEYDILVTTPIVEVGIDIPSATIMVIEGADRFGLAQLHQLRGRVGRSSSQSYCLLFSPTPSDRIKALETMTSGFELAENDLKLRGAGNIYGTSQHGVPNFKIARYDDFSLIPHVQKEAQRLLPKLNELPLLRDLVEKDKIDLIQPN